ncbi:MAG: HAD family hydrolase [Streptosporangiales bacterium]
MPIDGPVDAVLLDAGGVLIMPDPDVILPALAALGVEASASQLDRAHYASVAARDQAHAEAGLGDWEVYTRTYAEVCGAGERAGEVARSLRPVFGAGVWTRAVPGARTGVRELARRGLELAVISNAAGTVERQLRDAGVCQVADGSGARVRAVVDSYLAGIEKPAPGIFKLGLDAVGTAPERTVMVGDMVSTDVAGAVAVGLQPVHLDPFGNCLVPHAGTHVRDLAHLAELLERAL